MTETRRYNLALIPINKEFAQCCVTLARRNYATSADGYLLHSESALPHVTLCQFEIRRVPSRQFFIDAIKQLGWREVSLHFEMIYFLRGTEEHYGRTWIGLGVVRDIGFLGCQARLVKWISRKANCEPLTSSRDAYFPHLTLARTILKKSGQRAPSIDPAFWTRSHRFTPALGLSNENGVLSDVMHSYQSAME